MARFEPGRSGNPNGRPKVDGLVRDAARLYGEEAIAKLVELMRGDDPRVAQSAANALLDRGYGKPSQSVELSGDADNPLALAVIERRIVKPAG